MTGSENGSASEAPLAGARVGRVALRVGDRDRLAAFYADAVGLERVDADDEGVALGADGEPLLVLRSDPDAPERRRSEAGLFHLAVRVPSRAALGAALERVAAHPTAELTGASDHHVSEALYLRDPEGNGVEIYRDRPRAEWPTGGDRVEMDSLPLDLGPLRAAAEGAGAPTDRVPAGTDVGHVHLETASLSDAESFYVDALGLRVRQRMDAALFLAADDYHHHLGVNAWNGRSEPAAPGSRGVDWYELLVPDGATLDRVRGRLADAGVDVRATDDGLAATDPDGIELRIAVA